MIIKTFNERMLSKKTWVKFKVLFYSEIFDKENLKMAIGEWKWESGLYECLSMYSFDDPELSFLSLTQKIIESERFEILPNEMIEYLLLSPSDIERLRIIEVSHLDDEIRSSIIQLAKNKLRLSISSIPKEYEILRKSLKPDLNIQKRPIQTPPLEFPELYELEGSNESVSDYEVNYSLSLEEKDIMTRLTFEEHSESETLELIKSMISLNFYTAALRLTQRLEFSFGKLYYQGYLNLKIGNYGEAVYFLNEYLNRVQPDDPTPFLKMKREAQLALGEGK